MLPIRTLAIYRLLAPTAREVDLSEGIRRAVNCERSEAIARAALDASPAARNDEAGAGVR